MQKIFFLFLLNFMFSCSHLKMETLSQTALGPIVSELTDHSTYIWIKALDEKKVFITLFDADKKILKSILETPDFDNDSTVVFELKDLKPSTQYYYQINSKSEYFSFKTPASPMKSMKFKMAWSGDVAGQNVCRDKNEGYIIFDTILNTNVDLFIGLGDMIYADDTCRKIGRYKNEQIEGDFDKSYNLENFRKHWRYNRADQNFRNLMAQVPYLAIWDDHEVINDFGPQMDQGVNKPYKKDTHLMPIGLKSFLEYNPIKTDTLYRKFSWGNTADIFILDTRQYRNANSMADGKGQGKTMLGKKQLAWFKKSLLESKSQFKIIVSSVPLSIPTGYPIRGDGWANFNTPKGYENELLEIVDFLHKNNINQTVWLTTDVHFAEVFKYKPYMDDDNFEIYEIAVGPLSAGLFPNAEYDTTLGPRKLFYYGAKSFYDVKTYEDAKKWSNFGVLDFDGKGKMDLEIINTYGDSVYKLSILSKQK